MKLNDLPKDKHFKFLEAAYMAALISPGAGRDNFRHGCVISYKKNILTIKYNCGKTHPKLLRFSLFPYLHAESYAILSLGLDNCLGKNLYVVRVMKNKEFGISKPCKACQGLIESVGIKDVFYSTYEGYERL